MNDQEIKQKEQLKSFIGDMADYLEKRIDGANKEAYQTVVNDLDKSFEELEQEIEAAKN
jgi:hypothetical protein